MSCARHFLLDSFHWLTAIFFFFFFFFLACSGSSIPKTCHRGYSLPVVRSLPRHNVAVQLEDEDLVTITNDKTDEMMATSQFP